MGRGGGPPGRGDCCAHPDAGTGAAPRAGLVSQATRAARHPSGLPAGHPQAGRCREEAAQAWRAHCGPWSCWPCWRGCRRPGTPRNRTCSVEVSVGVWRRPGVPAAGQPAFPVPRHPNRKLSEVPTEPRVWARVQRLWQQLWSLFQLRPEPRCPVPISGLHLGAVLGCLQRDPTSPS